MSRSVVRFNEQRAAQAPIHNEVGGAKKRRGVDRMSENGGVADEMVIPSTAPPSFMKSGCGPVRRGRRNVTNFRRLEVGAPLIGSQRIRSSALHTNYIDRQDDEITLTRSGHPRRHLKRSPRSRSTAKCSTWQSDIIVTYLASGFPKRSVGIAASCSVDAGLSVIFPPKNRALSGGPTTMRSGFAHQL